MNYLNSLKTNNEKKSIHKNRKRKKLTKIIIVTLVILIILALAFLFIVPHMVMNDMVNIHVNFDKMYSSDDFGVDSEKLKLETSDGLDVVAYEVSLDNPRAIVIFTSGIHNPSVTAFFGHAKMLKENNYGSILLEMRAHGESDGDVIGLGYKEHLDTKAAVDYITEKYNDIPIVVHGLSMGAATAINSIGEIEEIDGLISMSSYSSYEDVFYETMLDMDAPKAYAIIQKPFVKIYNMFKYGFKVAHITPENQIKKLGKRPALIMHSTEDSEVSFSSFKRIMRNAPKHVETYIVEGDRHLILKDDDYFLHPEKDKEYSKRILKFLDDNFKR